MIFCYENEDQMYNLTYFLCTFKLSKFSYKYILKMLGKRNEMREKMDMLYVLCVCVNFQNISKLKYFSNIFCYTCFWLSSVFNIMVCLKSLQIN